MSDPDINPSGIKRRRVVTQENVLPEETTEASEEEYDDVFDSDFNVEVTEESEDEEDEDQEYCDSTTSHVLWYPGTSGKYQPSPSETPIWTETPPRPFPDHIPFLGSPGLKKNPPTLSPINFFFTIATVEFFELILKRTNEYGSVCFGKEKSRPWNPVSEEEIKIFLGLLFHMGSIRLSRIKDYWRKDKIFRIPIFSHCMSRNRFIIILRSLHFSSLNDEKSGDELERVNPIIEFFNNTMETIYSPIKELCINESMILWRGRIIFRQYDKCHRYGIKLYMLTESNGLVLKFLVCAGNTGKAVRGYEYATNVVKKLLQERLGLGHSVYMDDYYNSYDLSKFLLTEKTYSTGTLRPIRNKNPLQVIDRKLRKGKEVHRYSQDGICVQKWNDRKDVLVISTEHDNSMIRIVNKRGVGKNKPKIVAEYNKFMRGEDLQDQMLAYYPIKRIALPWIKKLGIHIFHSMMLNSFYLYNKQFQTEKEKTDFYTFRLDVIKSLLVSRLQTPMATPFPRKRIHIPTFVPRNADTRRAMRKRCRNCKLRGKRKETMYMCPDCPDQPGLCLENCFRLYHNY